MWCHPDRCLNLKPRYYRFSVGIHKQYPKFLVSLLALRESYFHCQSKERCHCWHLGKPKPVETSKNVELA